MNKYQEAIDVMARYISDCKLGIKRYCDREIDSAMAKIVELEKNCDRLEKAFKINTHRYKVLLDRSRKMRHELEQALDKACEQLELMSEAHYISREEWKEWLMKDE